MVNNKKSIPLSDIPTKRKEEDNLSPQEFKFMGGTVDGDPKDEEWYIPPATYNGDIDGVDQARQRDGFIKNAMLAGLLGIMDKAACIWLSPLIKTGPKAGQTAEDPKIIGFWDEELGEIVDIEGRNIEDLNKELLEKFKSADPPINLHLRPESHVHRETEIVGGPELKG